MGSILAIDPGPMRSAMVVLDNGLVTFAIQDVNDHIVKMVKHECIVPIMAIEVMQSFGKIVGQEVFDTCIWAGRFWQAFWGPVVPIKRMDVKIFLCGDTRAKDSNIRQAIIDRFGGKVAAVGSKARPGPLKGVTGDMWSALAVALTASSRTEGDNADG